MSARVDRETAAILRALVSFLVGEMHCGLSYSPPGVRPSPAERNALEALRAASIRLRRYDDEPAEVFALVLDLARALAPMGRGGFRTGVIVAELYCRAVLARAKATEDRDLSSAARRPPRRKVGGDCSR